MMRGPNLESAIHREYRQASALCWSTILSEAAFVLRTMVELPFSVFGACANNILGQGCQNCGMDLPDSVEGRTAGSDSVDGRTAGPPGRTHQLRKHMAMIGHPILGDPRYTYGYMAQRQGWASHPAESAINNDDGNGSALGAHTPPLTMNTSDGPVSREAVDGAGSHTLEGNQVDGDELQQQEDNGEPANKMLHARSIEEDTSPEPVPGNASETVNSREHGLENELCLWAVQVRLRHPVNQAELDVQLDEPPGYCEMRARHREAWEQL